MNSRNRFECLVSTAIGVTCVLSCASAHAISITVPNYSFETNGQVILSGNGNILNGWTFAQPSGEVAGAQNQNSSNPTGTDQNLWAFVNLANAQPSSTVSTITSAADVTTIAANTTYTLTIAVGNNNQTNDYANNGPYSISLLSNGAAIAGATGTFSTVVPNSTFTDLTTSFTTGGGSDPLVGTALRIKMGMSRGTDTDNNGRQGLFDNVRLTAVPEPGSVVLLALGAIGLLAAAYRKS